MANTPHRPDPVLQQRINRVTGRRNASGAGLDLRFEQMMRDPQMRRAWDDYVRAAGHAKGTSAAAQQVRAGLPVPRRRAHDESVSLALARQFTRDAHNPQTGRPETFNGRVLRADQPTKQQLITKEHKARATEQTVATRSTYDVQRIMTKSEAFTRHGTAQSDAEFLRFLRGEAARYNLSAASLATAVATTVEQQLRLDGRSSELQQADRDADRIEAQVAAFNASRPQSAFAYGDQTVAEDQVEQFERAAQRLNTTLVGTENSAALSSARASLQAAESAAPTIEHKLEQQQQGTERTAENAVVAKAQDLAIDEVKDETSERAVKTLLETVATSIGLPPGVASTAYDTVAFARNPMSQGLERAFTPLLPGGLVPPPGLSGA